VVAIGPAPGDVQKQVDFGGGGDVEQASHGVNRQSGLSRMMRMSVAGSGVVRVA
jgi:hypothetical protein